MGARISKTNGDKEPAPKEMLGEEVEDVSSEELSAQLAAAAKRDRQLQAAQVAAAAERDREFQAAVDKAGGEEQLSQEAEAAEAAAAAARGLPDAVKRGNRHSIDLSNFAEWAETISSYAQTRQLFQILGSTQLDFATQTNLGLAGDPVSADEQAIIRNLFNVDLDPLKREIEELQLDDEQTDVIVGLYAPLVLSVTSSTLELSDVQSVQAAIRDVLEESNALLDGLRDLSRPKEGISEAKKQKNEEGTRQWEQLLTLMKRKEEQDSDFGKPLPLRSDPTAGVGRDRAGTNNPAAESTYTEHSFRNSLASTPRVTVVSVSDVSVSDEPSRWEKFKTWAKERKNWAKRHPIRALAVAIVLLTVAALLIWSAVGGVAAGAGFIAMGGGAGLTGTAPFGAGALSFAGAGSIGTLWATVVAGATAAVEILGGSFIAAIGLYYFGRGLGYCGRWVSYLWNQFNKGSDPISLPSQQSRPVIGPDAEAAGLTPSLKRSTSGDLTRRFSEEQKEDAEAVRKSTGKSDAPFQGSVGDEPVQVGSPTRDSSRTSSVSRSSVSHSGNDQQTQLLAPRQSAMLTGSSTATDSTTPAEPSKAGFWVKVKNLLPGGTPGHSSTHPVPGNRGGRDRV